ncbi:hypothetical protein CPB84DRAFT_1793774 [Gymnopilus junonius]|uniref:Uncharacterized protein n=1 Tax=Gymnopilus junonius TaxID=109634 RepID=A0A9P5NCK0_GYMJU|nr:hypothetical protein CPB84DRAFT_1793774 [Gymnopilus junonius]
MSAATLPSYDAPSVTDDISNLMTHALGVQESLRKAHLVIEDVDNAAGTDLSALLTSVDNKYIKLLNHSRESANKLNSVIRNFVDVVIPVAQNSQYPFAKRLDHVKKTARKIADAANDNSAPFKSEVDGVKTSLVTLRDQVAKLKGQIATESAKHVDQLQQSIATIVEAVKAKYVALRYIHPANLDLKTFRKPTTTIKPTTKPSDPVESESAPETPAEANGIAGKGTAGKDATGKDTAAGAPKPFKFGAIFDAVSIVGKFFESHAALEKTQAELDAKLEELADLKRAVDKKNAQLQQAGRETYALVTEFGGLISKIGNFDAIWSKLNADSAALNDYLESNNEPDEEVFIEKVQAEAPVYVNIRQALDDYCLRVQ